MRIMWPVVPMLGVLFIAALDGHANEQFMNPRSGFTYETKIEGNDLRTYEVPAQAPHLATRSNAGSVISQTDSALSLLGQRRAAVAIVTKASVPLRIFLLRAGVWQEYILNPAEVTAIRCEDCGEALTFSFHDGEEVRTFVVPSSTIISVTPDESRKHWNVRAYKVGEVRVGD